MGGVQSITVPPIAVPIDEKTNPNESCVWRNLHCFDENSGELESVIRSQPEVHTAIGLVKGTSIRYPDVPTGGERIINPDGTPGPFSFITYRKFYSKIEAFGRGLLELGLERGSRIGIYSQNSLWWQIVANGAYSVGMAIVPIYDSLGPDSAQYISKHSEISAIFCSSFKYPNALDIISSSCPPELRYLIVAADQIPSTPSFESTTQNTMILTGNEVLQKGFESERKNELAEPDDVAMIMYTSGTTGNPKGCILKQRNLVAGAAGFQNANLSGSPTDLYLSFLPLAHVLANVVELLFLAQGIRIAYARGPVRYLLDDIQTLQPTVVTFVPRVLNRVHDEMMKQINALPKFLSSVIKWTIHEKYECMKQNKPQSLLLDAILFSKFRSALGGKLRMIISGGAPLMPEIMEFVCGVISPNIVQGYGMTEGTAGISVQELPTSDPMLMANSTAVDIKLAPVEGNDEYNPRGNPPTGELWIRGPTVFSGYLKEPELTKAAFSEDGKWFKTGDVITVIDGKMKIIDRAKQLVKLSQGEYISLTLLTEYYSMAEGVAFVYIYASSQHDCPVAAVVPTQAKIHEWNKDGIVEIGKNEHVKSFLLKSLDDQFKFRKMRGFERITHILVDPVEPSVENGLLTPSMKPQMKAIRQKYDKDLEQLYGEMPSPRAMESSSS